MAEDKISQMLKLDDQALAAALGFADKVKSFKDDLTRADKLEPKFRKGVNESLEKMFKPNIWPEDLKYKVDHAEKKQKDPDCDGPADVVTCAGDCGCD